MTMTNDWIEALNRSLRGAVSLVLKMALTLAGLVFMLGVVVLGCLEEEIAPARGAAPAG